MVTRLTGVGPNVAGKIICPSGPTARSGNVVVSPSADLKITVTVSTLLSGPTDTDVTCGAESTLVPRRSKVIVGFCAVSSVEGSTIHGEDGLSYFWISSEDSSFVTVTWSSGMSGLLPSLPIRSCSGQRTVVVVPSVVVLVVTVARVVVVVSDVAAVVVVGGAEVDAVVPAGVDAVAVVVPSVVVLPSVVDVPSVVVVTLAVVVAGKGKSRKSSRSSGNVCVEHQLGNQNLSETQSSLLHQLRAPIELFGATYDILLDLVELRLKRVTTMSCYFTKTK